MSTPSPSLTARPKLVCTLGPATNTPAFVRGLVTAGASIFRVNFSHVHVRRPRARGGVGA